MASDTLAGAASETTLHLPHATTRFFGRDGELAAIQALFIEQGHRLVTLTGPGGIGKSRLAVKSAALLHALDGAVTWFVPLADVTDAGLLPQAILAALGTRADAAQDIVQQVANALSGSAALLVLDNFERLVEQGAPLVLGLLERTPTLSCLVTSRRQLGLPGERVLEVTPLPLPALNDTLERLADRPSVCLFVDRAQAKAPEFQVTERNRQAVSELVCILEGIPLALEMAAVWIRVHPLGQMVTAMKDRYGLLTRNARGMPDRHSTLNKAVAWSYDLLPPGTQRFLGCLSVFRGGCTLEAAEAVSQEAGADGLLEELHEHSWLTGEERGVMRFRMLETLREFAADRLSEPQRVDLARRHAEYCLKLAEAADPSLPAGLDRLEDDLDNLRAALAWAGGHRRGGAALGLALAERLRPVWVARGHLREAGLRLGEVLAWPEAVAPSERVGRLWLGLAQVRRNLGDYGGSETAYRAADAVAERLDLPGLRAEATNGLGNVRWGQDRLEEARDFYNAALAQPSDRIPLGVRAISLENLGNCWGKAGQYETARECYDRAAELFVAVGNPWGAARVDHNHAVAAKAHGRFNLALPLFERSLAARWDLRDAVSVAYSLEGIADTLYQQDDYISAVVLLGAADALRTAIAAPKPSGLHQSFMAMLDEVRAALGAGPYNQAWEEGRAMQAAAEGAQVPLPDAAVRYAQAAIAKARLTPTGITGHV